MFCAFNLDLFLDLKPGGHYRVEVAEDGRSIITVSIPGEPVEVLHCASPGLANQAALQLSDNGLTGFVANAR